MDDSIFGEGFPFSLAQSTVQFTNQADTTQGMEAPSQRDATSSSATMSSYSTHGSQQEDILLAGMDDLEDNP